MIETSRIYTHRDVLTIGVAEGWADAQTDPTRIDWAPRQARAVIPFEVVDGRPVNPCEKTGIRYGRNELGHWGEQVCADAIVIATDEHGHRWLVMVERGDGHGWALPGGTVEAGEAPAEAAVRELAEETGLSLEAGARWQPLPPRYVPDPRASDEAWMVTVPARCDLGTVARADLPAVAGADDAARAAWVRADSYPGLTAHLAMAYGGRVFAAHTDLLRDVLDQPASRPMDSGRSHLAASVGIYAPRSAEMRLTTLADAPSSGLLVLHISNAPAWFALNSTGADIEAEAEAMERLAELATEAAARLRAPSAGTREVTS
ncbi:NUDIX domain-containing protein [Streptosporangium sp. NPDC048047]|uniref:NUDIX domain-containing protein n=1 Tax=Streptosporangium sp. NPDC048047 TaxID=3155748 RepID=UPI00342F5C47